MKISGQDELTFLPLGGAGEIGMNLNLYGYGAPGEEAWLMLDLGITFNDGTLPGIDILMPDPTFIEERRDSLVGLVLTHAHEDHLGAVPYLWDRLRCPIFATPFTHSILRRKLADVGLEAAAPVTVVEQGDRFRVGPFEVELIGLTHSIPEANAVAIRTAAGTVLHTGDWKLDPGPVVGAASNEARLAAIGEEGVLAMVCDSTNALTPGGSGSEADLLEPLTRIIADSPQRVAVTCFATNVARLKTIATAARANGRDVVLAGRSLLRIDEAARENGYLDGIPAFIDESEAPFLPRDKAVIICTGSQGEPRSSLSRIALGEHPNITLESGDTVVFSARMIPSNEGRIVQLQNRLVRRGVRIVTSDDEPVHVSGHPARDELLRMYSLVRPQVSVPVHGEARHLAAHADLARSCQVSKAVIVENGAMLRLAPGPVGVVDHVRSGRMACDGGRLLPVESEVIRSRNRAAYNGAAVVTIAVNGGGLAEPPQIATFGLIDEMEDDLTEAVHEAIGLAIADLPARSRRHDERMREAVRIAVRRTFYDRLRKKPVTKVHLVRL